MCTRATGTAHHLLVHQGDTGVPLVNQEVVGRTAADPGSDHAWMTSLYRLEDHQGHTLGVAKVAVEVTDRYRAAQEAERAQRRVRLIARGPARTGTTLEVARWGGHCAFVENLAGDGFSERWVAARLGAALAPAAGAQGPAR